MENIFLALTNIGCVLPVINYYVDGKYLQSSFIGLAGFSSFVYHLIECKKHKMQGIGYFNTNFYHQIFINFDRFFAVGSVVLCYTPNIFNHMYLIILALVSVFISEAVSRYIEPINKNWRFKENRIIEFLYSLNLSEKYTHVVSHSIWHITIFELARLLSIE